MVTVTDRDTPARQWIKTPRFCVMPSSEERKEKQYMIVRNAGIKIKQKPQHQYTVCRTIPFRVDC